MPTPNQHQLELPLATSPTGPPLLPKSVREECQALLAQIMKEVLRGERRQEAGHER